MKRDGMKQIGVNLGVIVNARDNTGGDEMKSRQVSFSVPSHARELIAKIADRACAESPADGYARTNYMALCMDLTAAHANGRPLRLEDLLAADSLNFWHDVAGIVRHLDRKTGRLGDCFVPRFAAQ